MLLIVLEYIEAGKNRPVSFHHTDHVITYEVTLLGIIIVMVTGTSAQQHLLPLPVDTP